MVLNCTAPAANLLSQRPDRSFSRPGVYAILCDANGKYYVGSSGNIRARILDHYHSLVSGRHSNPRLLHAFQKYGEKRFLFNALEFTEKSSNDLLSAERRWIGDLNSVQSGFNIMPAANSPLGIVRRNTGSFREAAIRKAKDPNHKWNRKYKFVSPKGEIYEGFNVAQFCRDRGFGKGATTNFHKLAKGDIGSYSGWKCLNSVPTGRRRGWPVPFSIISPDGVTHTGENIAEFCRSIGVHRGFFSQLIKGKPVRSGWKVTPGFVFKKKGIYEFSVISPSGETQKITNVRKFSLEHGLNHRCLWAFLNSNAEKYKGWRKSPCM